jgi:hypothetical protein
VSELHRLTCLRLCFERKQIPQTVENTETPEKCWSCWKVRLCAQGRCATRLRYAPTLKNPPILRDLLSEPGARFAPRGEKCLKTVSKLSQNLGRHETCRKALPTSLAFRFIFSKASRFIWSFICEYGVGATAAISLLPSELAPRYRVRRPQVLACS